MRKLDSERTFGWVMQLFVSFFQALQVFHGPNLSIERAVDATSSHRYGNLNFFRY